jgi:hypothetical protein
MKKTSFAATVIVLAIVVFVFLGKWLHAQYGDLTVQVPMYPPIERVAWLDQHWTPEQREWFHHADQGTQTFGIPYEWFVALEQPSLSFAAPGLLSNPAYLDRYGFIPSTNNPGKLSLPIGFSHGGSIQDSGGAQSVNPNDKTGMSSLGLTCAACHTGRFTYGKTTVLIEGAPALIDMQEFQKAIALSIIYTRWVPGRFARFADRVLGVGASDDARLQLGRQFDEVCKQVRMVHDLEKAAAKRTVEEGFARLDALNRIGNTVFALDLNQHENFVGYSAPVHFPRIWDASWFNWVQYNGSIQRPMTRNAGEALGVHAAINFPISRSPRPTSSLQLSTIYEIEQLLAGDRPPTADNRFTGLASPKWPDEILPPINFDLATKGAALYQRHCKGCHLPTTSDPNFWTAPQWLPANAEGERYLDLNMIDIARLGTDPAQAEDMRNRTVAFPASLGITDDSGQVVTSDVFGSALRQMTSAIVNDWYDGQLPSTPSAMRNRMNGFRPDGVRAPLQYKARPLNGIWATPPYLHNGSVPNLYALLSPVAERPKRFYLGNREYDPVKVGYQTDSNFVGAFRLDTSVRGNSNSGHEFNSGAGKGIIGPLLTPDERRALIEFLKSL